MKKTASRQTGDIMQLSLYRAERPEVFEEIIGQKHIVRILQNQIRTGTVSQAYLFSGTHGTGKTTTARILAKAVNCLEGTPGEGDGGVSLPCGHCANCEAIREGRFVDVIELDAASNNGVDDLRAIIDMVKYPPSVGRYKVYIIDEVHMLSPAAENAFLKTLEEPPAHAIFILATTDPQKVRSTIRSRCMQLNFKRVSEEELAAGMARICEKRGVEATKDALITIASRADGSVRDALSILEQCMAAGDSHLDRNLVLEYTGAAGEDFYLALTEAVRAGDINKIFIYIDEIVKRGKDAKQILKDWLTHYRNLLVVKYVSKPERIIGSSSENSARLKKQADALELSQIERAIRLISEYINIGKYSERPRILLETVA
ncbi:MAG: DNA polymerase III subunit gamma/tau, partial [Mogibacterium sp.]|nr:DNA polymerase III subunit gamma/tau [Mogibacterium sp.]